MKHSPPPDFGVLFRDTRAFKAIAPSNGSAGSVAGAASVSPKAVQSQADNIVGILKIVRDNAGRTREELAIAAEMKLSSVCARANELLAVGLIVEDGTRLSASGVRVAVLKLPAEVKLPTGPAASGGGI